MLVGMMGAGKSTVGALAGAALGWRFVDVDAEIERRGAAPVAELFAKEGEPAFRRLESEVLAECLASEGPAVIAAGGGVVLDPANRVRIAEGSTVVWLRAPAEALAQRVGDGGGRPLLAGQGDPAARLAELLRQRAPLYSAVADAIVDVDGRSPEEVAAEVVAVACAGDGAAP